MSVIKRPLITEKMSALGENETNKQYGFMVDINSGKVQIRKAIEDLYDVKVTSIRTMVGRGKKRSRYTKSGIINGKSANFKKAIITVADGDSIDFHKNI